MKPSAKSYRRIVIKIGSSLLFSGKKALNSGFLKNISGQIAQAIKQKKEILVVSSGAIAAGMHILKFNQRPKELASLQAFAAVGQHFLMNQYRYFFLKRGLESAQVLLTWDDFNDRRRYLNAKNTLLRLLELKAVPVINENDTVSTDEIKFGDNDRLSALVSSLVSSDLLIILTDVDGLLDKENRAIKIVDEITPGIRALACPTDKKVCVGGMIAKIDAAKIAVDSGIPCVIANGLRGDIISSVIRNPEENGTLFAPKKGYLSAKERWIAFGTKPKGKIIVDEGAKQALVNKKSLLSVGIAALTGNFESGDIVSISDRKDSEFARGKVRISSKQLEKVKGNRSEKEVIHCDNIVLI